MSRKNYQHITKVSKADEFIHRHGATNMLNATGSSTTTEASSGAIASPHEPQPTKQTTQQAAPAPVSEPRPSSPPSTTASTAQPAPQKQETAAPQKVEPQPTQQSQQSTTKESTIIVTPMAPSTGGGYGGGGPISTRMAEQSQTGIVSTGKSFVKKHWLPIAVLTVSIGMLISANKGK